MEEHEPNLVPIDKNHMAESCHVDTGFVSIKCRGCKNTVTVHSNDLRKLLAREAKLFGRLAEEQTRKWWSVVEQTRKLKAQKQVLINEIRKLKNDKNYKSRLEKRKRLERKAHSLLRELTEFTSKKIA